MKLAEALTQMKDLKGKIAATHRQLTTKQTVMKLSESQIIPNNDPLIGEIQSLSSNLSNLKSRVAKTNVKHGLTNLIHQLEEAKFMVSALEPLKDIEQVQTTLHAGGYGAAQEKVDVHATFDVAKAKETYEAHQKRLREIDLELQKRNWVVDLID